MSSLSFLSVLSGASLILLLTAASQAQYHVFTPTPDYDDYNATFDYSFFSNTSSEDLEKFSERFFDPEEDTGGQEEDEETATAVTTATTRGTTEQDNVHHNAASLPVPQEIRTLVWTLVVLMSLNTQLLQHTL